MTFKDLQKLIDSQSSINSNGNSSELRSLISRLRDSQGKGKPFWYFEPSIHRERSRNRNGQCCFNHTIGLPTKNGKEYPMFDYEKFLYMSLLEAGFMNRKSPGPITDGGFHKIDWRTKTFYTSLNRRSLENITYKFKEKHLWVLKATGLGVTEFFLRIMVWLCLRNDDYKDSQMVVVTGPNQDLAIKIIKRMKSLFEPHGVTFDTKETMLNLNGCSIEAYPSNHIDAFRSLTNPKFILLDEADFFRKSEQEDVRQVTERYIGKSDPYIVMVSTPNAPEGLFEQIQKEPPETCIYKKIFLDYTYGLDKIYTKEEIDKAKISPSFEREYNLKYLGLTGNVFSQKSIDNATKIQYNPDIIVPEAKKSMGIDPGFGSSSFAIVATQLVNSVVQIIYAEEFPRASFPDMIDKIWRLRQQFGNVNNIYVDAANPEIWSALKKEFGERYDAEYIRETVFHCKKFNLDVEDRMLVVPTPFSVEGGRMLQHVKWLLEEREEDGSSLIAIHKDRFSKLIIALRTAVANEYRLDKERTSYDDILDAFRLSLQFYKRTK